MCYCNFTLFILSTLSPSLQINEIKKVHKMMDRCNRIFILLSLVLKALKLLFYVKKYNFKLSIPRLKIVINFIIDVVW